MYTVYLWSSSNVYLFEKVTQPPHYILYFIEMFTKVCGATIGHTWSKYERRTVYMHAEVWGAGQQFQETPMKGEEP
jgi:hypothetical protein